MGINVDKILGSQPQPRPTPVNQNPAPAPAAHHDGGHHWYSSALDYWHKGEHAAEYAGAVERHLFTQAGPTLKTMGTGLVIGLPRQLWKISKAANAATAGSNNPLDILKAAYKQTDTGLARPMVSAVKYDFNGSPVVIGARNGRPIYRAKDGGETQDVRQAQHGFLSKFKENPWNALLDVSGALTGGAGAVAKAGEVARGLDLISAESKLAKLGEEGRLGLSTRTGQTYYKASSRNPYTRFMQEQRHAAGKFATGTAEDFIRNHFGHNWDMPLVGEHARAMRLANKQFTRSLTRDVNNDLTPFIQATRKLSGKERVALWLHAQGVPPSRLIKFHEGELEKARAAAEDARKQLKGSDNPEATKHYNALIRHFNNVAKDSEGMIKLLGRVGDDTYHSIGTDERLIEARAAAKTLSERMREIGNAHGLLSDQDAVMRPFLLRRLVHGARFDPKATMNLADRIQHLEAAKIADTALRGHEQLIGHQVELTEHGLQHTHVRSGHVISVDPRKRTALVQFDGHAAPEEYSLSDLHLEGQQQPSPIADVHSVDFGKNTARVSVNGGEQKDVPIGQLDLKAHVKSAPPEAPAVRIVRLERDANGNEIAHFTIPGETRTHSLPVEDLSMEAEIPVKDASTHVAAPGDSLSFEKKARLGQSRKGKLVSVDGGIATVRFPGKKGAQQIPMEDLEVRVLVPKPTKPHNLYLQKSSEDYRTARIVHYNPEKETFTLRLDNGDTVERTWPQIKSEVRLRQPIGNRRGKISEIDTNGRAAVNFPNQRGTHVVSHEDLLLSAKTRRGHKSAELLNYDPATHTATVRFDGEELPQKVSGEHLIMSGQKVGMFTDAKNIKQLVEHSLNDDLFYVPHSGPKLREHPGQMPQRMSGASPPKEPSLTKLNQGVRMITARYMPDGVRTLTDGYLKMVGYAQAVARGRFAWEHGLPLHTGDDLREGWYAVRPPGAKKLSREELERGDLRNAIGDLLEGDKEMEDWLKQNVVSSDPKEISDWKSENPDVELRQISPSDYRLIFGEFKGTNRFLRNFDRAQNFWRTMTLTYRPAWVVNNVVGQTLLYFIEHPNLVHSLPSFVKSVQQEAKVRGGEDSTLSRSLRGAGFFRSEAGHKGATQHMLDLRDVRSVGDAVGYARESASRMTEAINNFNAAVSDNIPRRAAFREETRHYVKLFNRIEGTNHSLDELVNHLVEAEKRPSAENSKMTEALLEHVNNKVRDALVDFGNLSHFERSVVRRLVPFYSWIKGITKVTAKLALENPGRLDYLRAQGQGEEAYLENVLGPEAYSVLQELAKAGPVEHTPFGRVMKMLSTAGLNPLSTPAQILQGASSAFTDVPGDNANLALQLTPLLQAVANTAYKHELFGSRQLSGSQAHIALDQLLGMFPQYKLATDIIAPGSPLTAKGNPKMTVPGASIHVPGIGDVPLSLARWAGAPLTKKNLDAAELLGVRNERARLRKQALEQWKKNH